MPHRKVALVIRIKLPDGSRRYCPPVFSGNGKLKPFHALVHGQAEHHPEAVYAIRHLEGRRPVYETVGPDPAAALVSRQRKETVLSALAAGLTIVEPPLPRSATRLNPAPQPGSPEPKRSLATAVGQYLNAVSAHKSRATEQQYTFTLQVFLKTCSKAHLEDLDRPDVLAFMSHLRSQGSGPRTVANRVGYLKSFFLAQGLRWPLLKTDRPRYTEKLVDAYHVEELRQLFAAASQEEYELFQFFVGTGGREQEVEFACWADVKFRDRSFQVTEKPDLKFRPKDAEERQIPIPDLLVKLLQDRRLSYPESRLIFPTEKGKPNGHFLRTLKKLAFRAALNCGGCYDRHGKCCAQHAICTHWTLHAFRRTYATMHHEAGVPARTIQRWLGHSDLETTLRYLAGSDDRSQRTRDLVNSTFTALDRSNAPREAASSLTRPVGF